jgi:hypothetical protein
VRQKGFAQILVIIMLLILVGAGAYYFGTKKESILLIPTQTPSSIATNTPTQVTPTTKPTTDPTANWKTYLNISANYSIKYPQGWGIENVSAGGNGILTSDARYIQIFYKVSTRDMAYGNLGIEETGIIPPSEEKLLTVEKSLGTGLVLKCNSNFTDNTKTWCWIKVPSKEAYLNIQVFKGQDSYANDVYEQILSTFKFTQ